MSRIVSYSALPSKRQARVRPCTLSARMPQSSAMRAMRAPLRIAGLQPVRIFSVTGTSGTAFTTARRISPTSRSSRSSAEPAALRQTFFAGQPMLMSMIPAPSAACRRAPSAICAGSLPTICTQRGPP